MEDGFFRCKDCWGLHLIPYSKLSEDPKQKVKVHIKCPKATEPWKSSSVYGRNAFERWVGDAWVYDNNVVEPEYIEECK